MSTVGMLASESGYRARVRRGFSLTIPVAKLAMMIERRLAATFDDYENDIVEWYRNGDGKRKGYTYPACEHGTSRWTDYDNICGPCEDGLSLGDGVYRRQIALSEAKRRIAKAESLLSVMRDMNRWSVTYDKARYMEMIENALDVNAYFQD
jgi:hypothetical protein